MTWNYIRERDVLVILVIFFFFSSRRRHTIFDCDWSSDVCSSDLDANARLTQWQPQADGGVRFALQGDRKSTRLNSSHSQISYAVFCLKKKKCSRARFCGSSDTLAAGALGSLVRGGHPICDV